MELANPNHYQLLVRPRCDHKGPHLVIKRAMPAEVDMFDVCRSKTNQVHSFRCDTCLSWLELGDKSADEVQKLSFATAGISLQFSMLVVK